MYNIRRRFSLFYGSTLQIDLWDKDYTGSNKYFIGPNGIQGWTETNLERNSAERIDIKGTYMSRYANTPGKEISVNALVYFNQPIQALDFYKAIVKAVATQPHIVHSHAMFYYNTQGALLHAEKFDTLIGDDFVTEWKEYSDDKNHIDFTLQFKTFTSKPSFNSSGG